VIDGFVRLANRASSDALWTDVLLLPPDPDKASSFLIEINRLRPQDTQKIADLLLGTKTLKAKTDIFVRGSYPVKAANGIVFSKEIGVLPAGTSVEVMDSQTFTTDVSHFSQIWIAYKDLGPH
jgi:2-phospho-L-lactate transferase/gluconeogenesis factor (CofD/UPF0052 family)